MSEDRLDVALLAVGLARSRTHARRIVEEGRARLDGRPVTKPSHPVPAGAALSVVDVPDGIEYASRAAHKLAGALDTLGLSPQGATCLDAGASTGGFTDVLLRRGAASVHAVDIGHDQLAAHVREDPRVVVRDGTSVRDLTEELLGTRVDLVVADLSFISLRTVLEPLAGVVREDGDLLLMVKPQFEVGRRALPKSGVVSDPAERVRAVREVVGTAAEHGLRLEAVGPSSLPGQDGNREYFVHLRPVRTGRRCTKYSRLPSCPGRELGPTASSRSPCSAAVPTTSRTARTRSAGSETTPDFGSARRPTSNWGLTMSSRSPSSRTTPARGSRTVRREMKDRSATTRSTRVPSSSSVRSRTLVPSRTTTRGSSRTCAASWSWPMSTACTEAAPRRSSTSVNPPVDAPASRQVAPCGDRPRVSRAPASLWAAREAYSIPSGTSTTLSAAPAGTGWEGLVTGRPSSRARPSSTMRRAWVRDRARPTASSATSSRSSLTAARPPQGGAARPRPARGSSREAARGRR